MASICFLAAVLPHISLAARGRVSVQDASRAGESVTPVQKVLQLLDGMLAKGKDAKHQEEVTFAKFQEWCEGVHSEKTKSIEESIEQITQLTADIDKAKSDAEILGREVAELDAAISKAKAEAESAMALRKKENSDFLAAEADLSESIDACQRAVGVLKARAADVPQSLAQVQKLPRVPAKTKATIESFLQMHFDASTGIGAPEANAYEFQSGGVIDILEKLTLKFKDQLLDLQKAEMNAKANYQVLMQQLEDNIVADEAARSTKTSARAGRREDAASAKGEMDIAEKAKADDEKTLSDTLAECHMKSEEYEKNQVIRAEEVKAIEKAMAILSSRAVAGHAETYLPAAALLQATGKTAALAQVLSTDQRDPDARRRAAAYLQARAEKLGSRYLSVMALHAAEDPFAKVKKMIKDLITKLMEEANEEADQHAYCTTELATNKQTRADKTDEVEKLSAKVDKLTSEAAQLATEIQQLSDSAAKVQGQRAQATRLRGEEKAANAKAVADAQEAQAAVQEAMEVLRVFYAKAAEAASASALLQNHAHGATRKLVHKQGQPYQGLQDDSTGVLGMLDVIASDFARLESETSAAEDQAVAAYEKFMAESSEDLAVKDTDMKYKEGKKQRTEELLRSSKKELGLTQDELAQAMDYYDKLKADCLDDGLSYQERRARRQEEIQSLQEALRILNGEDLA